MYQEHEHLDFEISTTSVQPDSVKSIFDVQIEELISQIELKDNENQKHKEILKDLEETFQHFDVHASIFGSCGNDLALKNSDIDIYLECGKFSLITS